MLVRVRRIEAFHCLQLTLQFSDWDSIRQQIMGASDCMRSSNTYIHMLYDLFISNFKLGFVYI